MDEEFVRLTKLVQDQKFKILPSLEKCFRRVDSIFEEAKQHDGSARMSHLFTSRMLTMYTQLNNILYCFEKMVEDDEGLASPKEVVQDVLPLDNNLDVAEEFTVGLGQQMPQFEDEEPVENNVDPASPDISLQDVLQPNNSLNGFQEYSLDLDQQEPLYEDNNISQELPEDPLEIEQASSQSTLVAETRVAEAPLIHQSATVDELQDDVPQEEVLEDSDAGSPSEDEQPSTSYSRLEEEDDEEGFELIKNTSRDTTSNDEEDTASRDWAGAVAPAAEITPVKIVTFADWMGRDPESVLPPTEPKYSAIDKMRECWDRAKARKEEEEKKIVIPMNHFEMEPCGIRRKTLEPPVVSPVDQKKKEDQPKFALNREELKTGDKASFCHVLSPSEFYLTTDIELVEAIANAVNEHCHKTYFIVKAKYPTKVAAHAIVGDYCFAFISNMKRWLRVEIVDWKWDDNLTDQVTFRSVDFGYRYEASFRFLRPMNSTFAEFPQVTHKCCLAELYPLDCTANTKLPCDWPQQTRESFFELCKMTDKFAHPFQVIYCHKESDTYFVDLIDHSKEDDDTLSTILLENGLAHQPEVEKQDLPEVEKQDLPTIEEEKPSGSGEACDLETYLDSMSLDVPETLNEAVAGYDAKDEARICPFTRPDGKCYKGASCRLEHAQFDPDGWTTDKIGVHFKPPVDVCLPCIEEIITVTVTHIPDCCHFYAQIINKPAELVINGKVFLFDESYVSFSAKLDRLDLRKMDKPAVMPAVGELVLVYLPANEKFVRARVLDVDQAPEQFLVFFVDFGLVQLVEGVNIRSIRSDLASFPFQAVEMRLYGYKQRGNVDPTKVKEFGMRNMKFVLFKARVIFHSTNGLVIQMWDSKNANVEFGQVLINFGLAVPDASPILDCEMPLY